jgi:hypothetical protein
MFQAQFMIENPLEITATMKVTMTVKEWEELRDQLENKWPASRLSLAITSLLSEARRVIYAEEKEVL